MRNRRAFGTVTMDETGTRRLLAGLAALLILLPGCARNRAGASPEFAPVVDAETAPLEEAPVPQFVDVPAGEIPRIDSAAGSEEAPYEIGIGDQLEISVYGDPDLTRTIPVRPDGKISFTFVGDVQAAGRTIEDLRDDLKSRLSNFLRSPEITVIARDFGAQKVYAGGELSQPGLFYITPRENTIMDVVYKAGLPTASADLANAVLVRDGRLVTIDFSKLMHGDFTENVVLRNNDLIHFPLANERFIYVLGEVNRPTTIETTTPLKLVNVIATAGGPQPAVAKVKEIAVLRGGLRSPKIAVVNFNRLLEGDLSQNIDILPGDIVFVPTTGLGKYSRFIEQILRTFSLLFQARVVRQGFE